MPHLEMVIAKGNVLLSRERIGELQGIQFDVTQDVSDEILAEHDVEELAQLRHWPQGIRTVFRAALYSAIHRESPSGEPAPVPVTLAWAPAYDYEINVSEARGTTGTTMTIQLRGPYDKEPPVTQ